MRGRPSHEWDDGTIIVRLMCVHMVRGIAMSSPRRLAGDDLVHEVEDLVGREPRPRAVRVARGAADRAAAAPARFALIERVQDRSLLRCWADREAADELRLLCDGVSDRAVEHLLVRDGLGVALRVEQVEDKVVAGHHDPAAVALVGDLEGARLGLDDRHHEFFVHQCADVAHAGFEQLDEVGRAVGLVPTRGSLGGHRVVEELAAQRGVEHRVCWAVSVHGSDRLHERADARLGDSMGVAEQPHREGGVAVHVVDVGGVSTRVEAEQDHVHDLLTRGPCEGADAAVVMVETLKRNPWTSTRGPCT